MLVPLVDSVNPPHSLLYSDPNSGLHREDMSGIAC